MKTLVMVLSVLVSVKLVAAETDGPLPSLAVLKQREAELSKLRDRADSDRKGIDQDLSNLNSEVDSERISYRANQAAGGNCLFGTTFCFNANSAELAKREKTLEAQDAKIEGLKVRINKQQDLLSRAQDAYHDAYTEWSNAQSAVALKEAEFEKLGEDLQTLQVQRGFDQLKTKTLSLQEKLDKLESQYDKSLMAAYMQEKMTKLMNSDAFCSAAKTCADGGKAKVGVESLNQQVFNNATPNARPSSVDGGTR